MVVTVQNFTDFFDSSQIVQSNHNPFGNLAANHLLTLRFAYSTLRNPDLEHEMKSRKFKPSLCSLTFTFLTFVSKVQVIDYAFYVKPNYSKRVK